MTFWWAQSCLQIALAIDVLPSSWRGGSFYAIWGLFPGTCLSFFWNVWCKKKISQILDTQNRRKKHPRNGPETTFSLTSKRPPASKAGASKPRKLHGFFGFFFFGVRQTKRERKKRGTLYWYLHPPNKLLFGWTQHRKHSTEANLPSVTTHNLWGAPGWERSEHNPLPTVASLPNFELLIRSNMGTFPFKREMKNSFKKLFSFHTDNTSSLTLDYLNISYFSTLELLLSILEP